VALYLAIVEPQLGPRLYQIGATDTIVLWPTARLLSRRMTGRYWGAGAVGASYLAWHLLNASLSDPDAASRLSGRLADALLRTAPAWGFLVDDSFLREWVRRQSEYTVFDGTVDLGTLEG